MNQERELKIVGGPKASELGEAFNFSPESMKNPDVVFFFAKDACRTKRLRAVLTFLKATDNKSKNYSIRGYCIDDKDTSYQFSAKYDSINRCGTIWLTKAKSF